MLEKIDITALNLNVFETIGKQWMMVTAGKPDDCNTMTVSWGGMGVMWGTPSATVYIRPQRHTKKFLDEEGFFSLSILPEKYRENLRYCGTHSGSSGDKWEKCGLTPETTDRGIPYIAEAELVLICRKQFCQHIDPDKILDQDVKEKWYPGEDYHYIYISEIVEAYCNT